MGTEAAATSMGRLDPLPIDHQALMGAVAPHLAGVGLHLAEVVGVVDRNSLKMSS